MKKIFTYIGSPRGEFFNTYLYINKLIEEVKKSSRKQLKVNIFHPGNTKIEKCIGCAKCFETGKCSIEKNDDIKKLKYQMLSSDLIIFGSPIYGGNITGDMKIFFDRITSWYHLMALRGKNAIFIFTSSGNGVHFSIDFANFIMCFLGLNIIDIYNVSIFSRDQIAKDKELNKKIIDTSKLILKYINGEKKVESNQNLETVYSNLKSYVEKLKELNCYEYKYWNKNKMLNFKSFAELLKFENKKR